MEQHQDNPRAVYVPKKIIRFQPMASEDTLQDAKKRGQMFKPKKIKLARR